jgi:hypothetical protein
LRAPFCDLRKYVSPTSTMPQTAVSYGAKLVTA